MFMYDCFGLFLLSILRNIVQLQTCLIQVVRTFAKHWFMQRAHKKRTLYSIQLLQLIRNEETSRKNARLRFWQSKRPLRKRCPSGPGTGVWASLHGLERPQTTGHGEQNRREKAGECEGSDFLVRTEAGTGTGTGPGRDGTVRGCWAGAGSCCPLLAAAPPRPHPGRAKGPSAPRRAPAGLGEMLSLCKGFLWPRWDGFRGEQSPSPAARDALELLRLLEDGAKWVDFGFFLGLCAGSEQHSGFEAIIPVFLTYRIQFWCLQRGSLLEEPNT